MRDYGGGVRVGQRAQGGEGGGFFVFNDTIEGEDKENILLPQVVSGLSAGWGRTPRYHEHIHPHVRRVFASSFSTDPPGDRGARRTSLPLECHRNGPGVVWARGASPTFACYHQLFLTLGPRPGTGPAGCARARSRASYSRKARLRDHPEELYHDSGPVADNTGRHRRCAATKSWLQEAMSMICDMASTGTFHHNQKGASSGVTNVFPGFSDSFLKIRVAASLILFIGCRSQPR